MSFRGSHANVAPSFLKIYVTSRLGELLNRKMHLFSTAFAAIRSAGGFDVSIVITMAVHTLFVGTILRETLHRTTKLLGHASELLVTVSLRIVVGDTSHPLVLLLLPLKH